MAVQNHLLSNTILIRPDDSDDSDNSLQGETMKVQVNIPFKYPYLFESGVCVCVNERPTHQMKQWLLKFFKGNAEEFVCSAVFCDVIYYLLKNGVFILKVTDDSNETEQSRVCF